MKIIFHTRRPLSPCTKYVCQLENTIVLTFYGSNHGCECLPNDNCVNIYSCNPTDVVAHTMNPLDVTRTTHVSVTVLKTHSVITA